MIDLPPEVLTGLIAGAVAWGGNAVSMRWLRRDVDVLRARQHGGPNSHSDQLQALSGKITALEITQRERNSLLDLIRLLLEKGLQK
jgi:hypothetical protein